MSKLKRFCLLLIMGSAVGLGLFSQNTVYAKENLMDFTVSPVIPSNQVGSNQLFFNLMMEPGGKQTLEVEVRNTSEKEIKVDVKVGDGSTNRNGVIVYGNNTKGLPVDETLKYPFLSILKTKPEPIVLKSKEKKNIKFDIEMPKEKLEGIVLGGINFKQVKEEEESDEAFSIVNAGEYEVGVILFEDKTDQIKPDLKLKSVKAAQVRGQNEIEVALQNPQPQFLRELDLKAKVTKKNSSKLLFDTVKTAMDMAPNSTMLLPISLHSARFEAGKYTLYLTATDKLGQEWEFKEDFDITREEAKKFNESSKIELDAPNRTMLYVILGVAGLFIILLIIYFIRRNKKKKAETARKKSSKRKSSKKSKRKKRK